jgi:hypothetical protein
MQPPLFYSNITRKMLKSVFKVVIKKSHIALKLFSQFIKIKIKILFSTQLSFFSFLTSVLKTLVV